MVQILSSPSRRWFTLLTVGWFGCSFFSHSAQAADFELVPMLQEVTLEDEAEKKIEVTVKNTTDVLSTFQIRVYDFAGLDESGGVAFLGASNDLEKKYSLASWMQPGKDSLTLLPEQSETIPIMITNRSTLGPGGHYGAVVFESIDTHAPEATNAIAVRQMIASLVFVKKVGGAVPALELTQVDYTHHPFYFSRELKLRFHNPGNVHVTPRGVLDVHDPVGRLVYRGIINETSAIILPESFRILPTSVFGVNRAWIPGRYRFTIHYRYDATADFQVWETYFWLFPPLLLEVLGGGVAIFGLSWLWRRYQKRKILLQDH